VTIMGRWASGLLMLSMALWTALTAAVGWYTFHGGGTPAQASASADVVVYDVAGPDSARQVHYLTRAQADATLLEPSPTPAPHSVGIAQPAPKYALSAGADTHVKASDPAMPRKYAGTGRPASKGVIVLDPGHGRGDPGATHYLPDGSGRWDITEADSNMLNAQLIRNDLVAMGYEVYLTRTGERDGPQPLPPQFITSDLFARVALAKAVNADLFLAIHGNGATVHSISGPETWYCGKRQDGPLNEQFATSVQQAMMDALHEYGYFPPNRGLHEDAETHHSGDFCQFVVTRESPVPAALLEFLFLTNDDDAHVLVDMRAHVIMARHVASAIDGFMKTRSGAP
jgi:N-acetylmuramoyl-L-alanine amidase